MKTKIKPKTIIIIAVILTAIATPYVIDYFKPINVKIRQLKGLAEAGHGKSIIELGQFYTEMSKYDEAIKWYESFEYKSDKMWVELGKLYFDTEQYDKAKKCFLEALNHINTGSYNALIPNKTKGEAALLLANTYKRRPDFYEPKIFNEAQHWYKVAVQLGNKEAIMQIGLNYYASSRAKDKDPVIFFKKAAELGNFDAMIRVALHYRDLKDYDKAIKWCEKAARFDNICAIDELGYLYLEINNVAKAKEWVYKGIALNQSSSIRILAYINKKSGNLPEAIKWYKKASSLDDYRAQYALGQIYQKKGDINQAIEWYNKAMPRDDSAISLAKIYQEKGDITKAIKIIEKITKNDSLNEKLFLMLGDFYNQQKNYKKAKKNYLIGAEIGGSECKRKVIKFLIKDGNTPELIDCYKSLANYDDDTDAMLKLEKFYKKNKNNAEAKKWRDMYNKVKKEQSAKESVK